MKRLLIANRSEIACRVIRTAHQMGIETVAVYSEVDANALHVQQASISYALGGNTPSDTYLNIEKIIQAALATESDAVHPGYGFLSENPDFAQAVIDSGLIWVGPSPASIRLLGSKAAAKRLATQAGVPCLPGYDGLDEYGLASEQSQSNSVMLEQAEKLGYPLMIKAINGGGGRGMRKVEKSTAFLAALESARQEAKNAFNDSSVLLERALIAPRHIEVQIFGDQQGHVVHLGERDCSVQRRHQKIIEESPSPVLNAYLRERICQSAVTLAKAANYYGAGTVEFLLELKPAQASYFEDEDFVTSTETFDDSDLADTSNRDVNSQDEHGFYLMEMNTRLQVEHPVTELRFGLDLVEWQINVANGRALQTQQNQLRPVGHAIELRLCAEDALFFPQTGKIHAFSLPQQAVRIDHALQDNLAISPFYDSMMGKWIVHGHNREQAIQKAKNALTNSILLGIETNQDLLQAIISHPDFIQGNAHITWLTDQSSDFIKSLQQRQNNPIHLTLLAAANYWHQVHGKQNQNQKQNPLTIPFVKPIRFQYQQDNFDFTIQEVFSYDQQNSSLQIGFQDQQFHFEIQSLHTQEKINQARLLFNKKSYTLNWLAANQTQLWVQTPWANAAISDLSFSPATHLLTQQTHSSLRSPMNGKVLQVLVQAGESVKKGQALVVLESMKLEQQLVASLDGLVTEVLIETGQQAKSGQILIQLSALESSLI
jgi:3-methylcrotonyl-CoA carboxylase alpha subunit/geranyl-CoA carboxylase alpha subunit